MNKPALSLGVGPEEDADAVTGVNAAWEALMGPDDPTYDAGGGAGESAPLIELVEIARAIAGMLALLALIAGAFFALAIVALARFW